MAPDQLEFVEQGIAADDLRWVSGYRGDVLKETAIQKLVAAAVKAGITVKIIPPQPSTSVAVFLAKKRKAG